MIKPKIFFSATLLFFLLFVPILQATSNNNIIDLNGTFSENGNLFDLENLKPGDWAEREITVSNQTDNEITYDINVRYIDGSEMFYNQLSLEITQGDEVLFHDKLSNFSLINDLPLLANSVDKIDLFLLFPPESGNEYQGLTTNAEIIITAYDDTKTETSTFPISTDSQSTDGSPLPSTATVMFNILLIGGALLLAGSLILLYLKRNKFAEE
ncbi:LPXTG cell wall anchor domain-containing protein [Gracilibacillus salitolerans]|uniref:LPXTG cell wall anchor domain-containing protein n=1 Tax=Gracilibacillus salitolerans TaxID=2663022 RepID=A0A5Q2TGW0_9BACI|nr:LPXTG cell wall anchor domain-containing protein [Gracilibacillus salitolerans]QGH34069.1 LPXTG cell wall anchor domain-containing protein [Gracilibacillus salitolerans]